LDLKRQGEGGAQNNRRDRNVRKKTKSDGSTRAQQKAVKRTERPAGPKLALNKDKEKQQHKG